MSNGALYCLKGLHHFEPEALREQLHALPEAENLRIDTYLKLYGDPDEHGRALAAEISKKLRRRVVFRDDCFWLASACNLSAARLKTLKDAVKEAWEGKTASDYIRALTEAVAGYKGRRYSKAKVPIGSIDEDIRSHILALNQLPFLQTIYSCSGHGRPGEGHVSVIYSSEDGRAFHDAVRAIAPQPAFRRVYTDLTYQSEFCVGPKCVVHYYFDGDEWDRLMDVVAQFAAKPSRQHGRRRYSKKVEEP